MKTQQQACISKTNLDPCTIQLIPVD